MATMGSIGSERRVRRQFSEETRCGSCWRKAKSVGSVARELDLTASALSLWVKHDQAERTKGKSGLMKEEREELARLRKGNRILAEERDILKRIYMDGSPPAKPMKVPSVRERRARSTLTGAKRPEKNGPGCRVSTSNCLPSS
jgi:transposase